MFKTKKNSLEQKVKNHIYEIHQLGHQKRHHRQLSQELEDTLEQEEQILIKSAVELVKTRKNEIRKRHRVPRVWFS